MGKIVKYCGACEEGFAEKFAFCPNCGAQLQAFELNPLDLRNDPKTEPVAPAVVESVPEPVAAAAVEETPVGTRAETAVPAVETAAGVDSADEDIFEFGDDIFDEPIAEATAAGEVFEEVEEVEIEPVAATTTFVPEQTVASAAFDQNPRPRANTAVASFDYQPTIVYEKNVKQRNTLLLGALVFCVVGLSGSYVYSMFNKYLDIAEIETPTLVGYVNDVEPVPMELEPEPKKAKDDGGGGGGGGKEEETQASKGRTATQVDNPFIAPSSKMDRVTDPEIAYRAATQGNRQAPQTDENYGLPTGISGRSDGTGTGGGLGEGRGRGQGTGNGSGLGTGNGSGSGGGNGNGNGDGDGDGDGVAVVKKPPTPVGPTEGVKIISRPRPNYTDAARQNQVQGKVVLRVTFSANGSIGAISVVSGLGNGLTEQAIAAARGIRFEPAKRGGVPYTVQKSIEYTFTIY